MAAVDGEVSRAEADGSGRHDVGEHRGRRGREGEICEGLGFGGAAG